MEIIEVQSYTIKKPLNQNNMENGKQPAFASTDGKTFANDGLTKREYFAAMAMQGYTGQLDIESRAKWSVEMADALLKALETFKSE